MGGSDDRRGAADIRRFEELYRENSEPIFRFCLRRTGDWAVAEDLVSAVFVEAWRHRREVDLAGRPPLPWLYAVAQNVLRNMRRAERRQAAALRRLPTPLVDFDTIDEVPDRLDAFALGQRVIALLEQHPAAERDAAALCFAHGLSYRAAAAALEVPVGTVRSRLFRARARLHALTPQGYEPVQPCPLEEVR